MNLLIEDLLEVAKMEGGQMSIHAKPLNAQTLVDDAIKMSEPLALRHQIRLIAECEAGLPSVLADYERILRVFSNLIVNAVKFSGASGKVRVIAAGGNETVRFSVIDSGPGIPPEDLERIFDRFWQADSADRRGAGLGLAIVKAIVSAHGGTIGVSSAIGSGSTFLFRPARSRATLVSSSRADWAEVVSVLRSASDALALQFPVAISSPAHPTRASDKICTRDPSGLRDRFSGDRRG